MVNQAHSQPQPSRVAVIVGASTKHDQSGDTESMPAELRWGLGGALSLRFSEDFTVVLMGRKVEKMQPVVDEIHRRGGHAIAIACDVANDESVVAAFEQAKKHGEIESLVFNASAFSLAALPAPHHVDPAYLQQGFDVGVSGCLRCVKQVIEPMIAAGRGSILLSGATLGLRGAPAFASMSPIKFALRSLGQSMFQSYAPQSVHVAHVVLDGIIDSPGTRARFASSNMQFLDPRDIADAFMMLHQQPKSCWSYELQLTPNQSAPGMRL